MRSYRGSGGPGRGGFGAPGALAVVLLLAALTAAGWLAGAPSAGPVVLSLDLPTKATVAIAEPAGAAPAQPLESEAAVTVAAIPPPPEAVPLPASSAALAGIATSGIDTEAATGTTAEDSLAPALFETVEVPLEETALVLPPPAVNGNADLSPIAASVVVAEIAARQDGIIPPAETAPESDGHVLALTEPVPSVPKTPELDAELAPVLAAAAYSRSAPPAPPTETSESAPAPATGIAAPAPSDGYPALPSDEGATPGETLPGEPLQMAAVVAPTPLPPEIEPDPLPIAATAASPREPTTTGRPDKPVPIIDTIAVPTAEIAALVPALEEDGVPRATGIVKDASPPVTGGIGADLAPVAAAAALYPMLTEPGPSRPSSEPATLAETAVALSGIAGAGQEGIDTPEAIISGDGSDIAFLPDDATALEPETTIAMAVRDSRPNVDPALPAISEPSVANGLAVAAANEPMPEPTHEPVPAMPALVPVPHAAAMPLAPPKIFPALDPDTAPTAVSATAAPATAISSYIDDDPLPEIAAVTAETRPSDTPAAEPTLSPPAAPDESATSKTPSPPVPVVVAALDADGGSESSPDETRGAPEAGTPEAPSATTGSARETWLAYARPYSVANDRPRVAVIVTGLGLSQAATTAAIRLPGEVTLGFSSYARNLQSWIDLARASGHEVMLDLPMEPVNYPAIDPGPQALLTSLSASENIERLKWHLGRAVGYIGVTHHMGSRFTASPDDLRPILSALRARGLMFLDARTSRHSVGAKLAAEIGLPRATNDRFIDAQASRPAIDRRLREIERITLRRGHSVTVGQAFPVTLDRLSEWLPTLAEKGIALAPLSALANKQTLR